LQTPIYALCDFELVQSHNLTLIEYIRKINKLDIVYIQYRDKINSVEVQIKNLKVLMENIDVPVIINDRLELLEFADGLHFGQEDIDEISSKFKLSRQNTIKIIRKKYPNKILGLSTHNEKEILEANTLELDYIGLGAYKNTSTKDVSTVLGEKISYLAKISKHPVGAIGGVTMDDQIPHISYNVIGSALLK
jgi:thiamine-phosphate pyrophosphorylase